MEAVPAASGVRRTVRVAAALVVGQLLLVVVIGWVTFPRADDHHGPGAAVAQLAAPAPVPPLPVAPTPATSQNQNKSQSTGTSTAGGARTSSPAVDSELPAAPLSSAAGSPTTAGTPPAGTVAPAPPGSTFGTASSAPAAATTATPVRAPSSGAPAATPSSTPSAVIRAGQPCTKMFALARDADGWLVRCLPTRYHQLRWKIV